MSILLDFTSMSSIRLRNFTLIESLWAENLCLIILHSMNVYWEVEVEYDVLLVGFWMAVIGQLRATTALSLAKEPFVP
jgi:hypothetical protein